MSLPVDVLAARGTVRIKRKTGQKKIGNKYLAWTSIEAANFAIRCNDTVKRYYQKNAKKM
jgi:transposase